MEPGWLCVSAIPNKKKGLMPAPVVPAAAHAVTTTRRPVHGWPGNRGTVRHRSAHLSRALQLRAVRHRALHAGWLLHLCRTMRRRRTRVHSWLVIHRWFVLRHQLVIHCGFMLHYRAVLHGRPGRCRRTMHSSRAVVRDTLPPRVMPHRVLRRTTYAVNVPRVMPMPAIPVRRPPAGHPAARRKRRKGKYCSPAGCVPVHRLAIGISENRKTIRIITRIRPRHGGTPPRTTHAHRCTRVHRIIIYRARTEAQRNTERHGHICHFSIHCHKIVDSLYIPGAPPTSFCLKPASILVFFLLPVVYLPGNFKLFPPFDVVLLDATPKLCKIAHRINFNIT